MLVIILINGSKYSMNGFSNGVITIVIIMIVIVKVVELVNSSDLFIIEVVIKVIQK